MIDVIDAATNGVNLIKRTSQSTTICIDVLIPGGGCPFKCDATELRDVEHGVALVAIVTQRPSEPLRATCRLPNRDLDGEGEQEGERKVNKRRGCDMVRGTKSTVYTHWDTATTVHVEGTNTPTHLV